MIAESVGLIENEEQIGQNILIGCSTYVLMLQALKVPNQNRCVSCSGLRDRDILFNLKIITSDCIVMI